MGGGGRGGGGGGGGKEGIVIKVVVWREKNDVGVGVGAAARRGGLVGGDVVCGRGGEGCGYFWKDRG